MALLRAFRSAMAELGVAGRLIATDITVASSALQMADVGELVPPVRARQYLPRLMELVRTHRIGLLVPLTDLDLLILARFRERFADAGCTVMIGPEAAIRACRDKARTARLVARAGLAPLRTMSLTQFRRRPFWPCFAKPIGGSAGIGAAMLRSACELAAHVATFGGDLILQEHAGGQEFTIDIYRDRQGQVRCVVPRQRLTVRAGEVAHAVTVRDAELMEAAVRLTGQFGGLWGAFCCQCRRGPGTAPRFFEVNPRFGGGAPLSIAAGANLPLYLLQEVLGLPITARLGEFTENLLMLRYDDAVFIRVEDPRALPGHDTPSFR